MPQAGFETVNPTSEGLHTHVLDRAATGVGSYYTIYVYITLFA